MNYGHRVGFVLLIMNLLLASCGQTLETPGSSAINPIGTLALPTEQPTVMPSPVSTRVMPVEVLTPPAPATITPIPDETLGLVVEVIDGNTIAVVMDGDPFRQAYQVRYLSVDVLPNEASSPWGIIAYETNRRLTNLKVVRLVRDETEFDGEGNLLRHVYLDNRLLSVILAEQGLARAAVKSPDTRFEQQILEAEAQAREEQRGIWGQRLPTPTAGPAAETAVTPAAITPTLVVTGTTTPSTIEAESTEEVTPDTTEEATAEPTSEAIGTPESN